MSHEVRLARTGLAFDEDAGRLQAADLVERSAQGLPVRLAAHHELVAALARLAFGYAQPPQHLAPAGTPRRIGGKQRLAQVGEIRGQFRAQRARRKRGLGELSRDHVACGSAERQASDQCLVRHDADGVPVGGRRQRAADGLFRRHVRQRAERPGILFVSPRPGERGGQAEVEQHGAASTVHHDVRRFHVAMQRIVGVELVERGRQVRDRGAKSGDLLGPERRRPEGERRGMPGQPPGFVRDRDVARLLVVGSRGRLGTG